MQDTIDDIRNWAGASHIDFAVIGNFTGDSELDFTIFVCSGGVYLADGLTGALRTAHHIEVRHQKGRLEFLPGSSGARVSWTQSMGKYGNH